MSKHETKTMEPLEPKYSRSPSSALQELMRRGGFLSPIPQLAGRILKKIGLALDVHLRPRDEVHIYCGLARILGVRLREDTVEVFADNAYKKYHEGLFRTWRPHEKVFGQFLDDYLDRVEIADRYTKKEGKLQADWSQVTDPWVPFDREAVLSYRHLDKGARGMNFSEVESARVILRAIASRPGRRAQSWAEPKDKLGNELDQLAVDGEGNLVLIEIKDASASPAQVFYSPLQLLQYIHEWRRAFGWLSISQSLQELINARKELGLMPAEVPPLTGGIRAAVCFGADTRSEEVKRRYYEALGVVNAHLPAHVLPVETWSYGDKNGPISL